MKHDHQAFNRLRFKELPAPLPSGYVARIFTGATVPPGQRIERERLSKECLP